MLYKYKGKMVGDTNRPSSQHECFNNSEERSFRAPVKLAFQTYYLQTLSTSRHLFLYFIDIDSDRGAQYKLTTLLTKWIKYMCT